MKLIIQIPCFNEENTLPPTLAALPRRVEGFDIVEWLVIDDGSSDRTAEIAKKHGVDHIVRLEKNSGLAAAFMAGIKFSLARGADIIVNTDADNQYNAADIPLLIEPILAGKTGFVIGLRPVYEIKEIPLLIKFLHKAGSIAVMKASGTTVTDPPSGFRAFSREVAENLRVYNRYTYTLETIIQAGNRGLQIETVKIRVNMEKLRPSRLMSSPYSYVLKSSLIILRSLLRYNPLRFILLFCLPLLITAAFASIYIYFWQSDFLAVTVLSVAAGALLFLSIVSLPVIFSCGDYAENSAAGGTR